MAKGPIITQFEPYPGVRPELVNVLFGKVFHIHDVLAGLLYLASRGVVQFDPTNTKKPFTVNEEIVSSAKLTPVQDLLISYTFMGKANALLAVLNNKSDPLSAAVQQGNTEARKELVAMGLFKENSLFKSYKLFIVLIGLLCISTFFGALAFIIVFSFIGMLPIFLFVLYQYVPTEEGKRAIEHMKGYEQFLETTEKNKTQLQVFKTTERLHEAIAYAVAFKHDASWGNALKDYDL